MEIEGINVKWNADSFIQDLKIFTNDSCTTFLHEKQQKSIIYKSYCHFCFVFFNIIWINHHNLDYDYDIYDSQ